MTKLTVKSSAAFHAGSSHYREGKTLAQNPFPMNTKEFVEWVEGWRFQDSVDQGNLQNEQQLLQEDGE